MFYEKDFDAQLNPGSRTSLDICSVNCRSHVWINQKRVCDYEGGFTPFDCEVTAVLHTCSNFVVIGVDSSRLLDRIPSVSYDWYNYGGLTRDSSVAAVAASFIDDYDLHLTGGATSAIPNRRDMFTRWARAGNPVTLSMPEADVDTSASTDDDGNASFE